jgi:hypothetical protein
MDPLASALERRFLSLGLSLEPSARGAERASIQPRRLAPPGSACDGHGAGRAASRALGHCLGNELSSVILAWLIPVAVGLLGDLLASINSA